MNRILILIPLFFFPFSTSIYAEKIYIYKHKNGNIVITNIEIPKEDKTENQDASSLKRDMTADKLPRKNVTAVQSAKTFNRQNIGNEKKRLEEELKRLKKQESADRGNAPYYQFYIKAYEDSLQLLAKDPAGYFNKQDELEAEAAKILRGHASPGKL